MAPQDSDSDGDSLTLEDLIREQKRARIAGHGITHGKVTQANPALSDVDSSSSLFVSPGPEPNYTAEQQNTYGQSTHVNAALSDAGSSRGLSVSQGPREDASAEHQSSYGPFAHANAALFDADLLTSLFVPPGPKPSAASGYQSIYQSTNVPSSQTTTGPFKAAFSTTLFKKSGSKSNVAAEHLSPCQQFAQAAPLTYDATRSTSLFKPSRPEPYTTAGYKSRYEQQTQATAAPSRSAFSTSLYRPFGSSLNSIGEMQYTYGQRAQAAVAPSGSTFPTNVFLPPSSKPKVASGRQSAYRLPGPDTAAPYNKMFPTSLFSSSSSQLPARHQSTYEKYPQTPYPFTTSLFKSSSSRPNDTAGIREVGLSGLVFSTGPLGSSSTKPSDQVGHQAGQSQNVTPTATPISMDLFASSPLRIRKQPAASQGPSIPSEAFPGEQESDGPESEGSESPPHDRQQPGMQQPTTPSRKPRKKQDPTTPSRKVEGKEDSTTLIQAQEKQESGSLAKLRTKGPAKSPTSRKKPSQKAKVETPQDDPDIVRQRLAAGRIIELELKGRQGMLDESLFGEEVIEDAEMKKQRLAEERETATREREAKMLAILRKEEEEKLAKTEQQKRVVEEAEAKKVKQAAEENVKKLKRDEERKKHQVAEALELEEKRRLSAEKLEKIRQDARKAAEEKARKRNEGLEVTAAEMERFKAKQEETRIWAASLTPSKTATSHLEVAQDSRSGSKEFPASLGAMKDLKSLEPTVDPLKTSKAKQEEAHRPASKVTKMTKTLNQNMSDSDSPSKISSLLLEIGAEPEPVFKKPITSASPGQRSKPPSKRPMARMKTVDEEESILEMPKTPTRTTQSRKSVQEMTPRQNNDVLAPEVEMESGVSTEFPIRGVERNAHQESEVVAMVKNVISEMVTKGSTSHPACTISEVPTSSKQYVTRGTTLSRATTPEFIPPAGHTTSTNVQATRVTRTFIITMDADPAPSNSSHESVLANITARKNPRPRTEAQKTRRKEQNAQKSQLKKKRQELIDEAEAKGDDLDEMELDLMLQLELEENQETSEKTKIIGRNDTTPDELTPHPSLALQKQDEILQQPAAIHSTFSAEEVARRKQQEEDIRMNLILIGRNPDAKRAPSIESEEDPDPRPLLGIQEPSYVEERDEQMSHRISESDVMKEIEDDADVQDDYEHPAKKRKLKMHHEQQNMMYSVQEITNKDGEEVVQSSLGQYTNIKDAIWAFRKQKAKYKKRKTFSCMESDTYDLFSCTIFYDSNGLHQQTVWVEPIISKCSSVPTFVFTRHIKHKHVDGKTGEEMMLDKAIKQGRFTSREMANKLAHDSLCAYLKPTLPNMDYVAAWKELCEQITAHKDSLTGEGEGFNGEIDTSDASWLGVDGVIFLVEMK